MAQFTIVGCSELLIDAKRITINRQKYVYLGEKSTGQTQRVGVARCVLHDPHNYILDEATSGLDIISSQV
ncbi:MAG: ATP-binding cassette domain-containing protein, partial [Bacteroidaceae bacterium]|nr:ATP-binding cassette domain-containing protein [Bacteroidaceae bacterium]